MKEWIYQKVTNNQMCSTVRESDPIIILLDCAVPTYILQSNQGT